MATILLTRFCDQFAEMRAELAVILGVGPVLDQVHFDKRVGIEARDRIGAKRGKIEPELVALGIQPAPADASREDPVVTGFHELTAIAVIDKDIAGLDASRLQLVDDLQDDFKRRMCVGLPVGDDLDADHVARLEKVFPSLDRRPWPR